MKILKISGILNKNGLSWNKVEWDAKETAKVFVLTRLDEKDGDLITRHLKKDGLMKIDSLYNNSTRLISFHVRCFEKDESEAKLLVFDKIISTYNSFKKELLELDIHIN